MTTDIKIKPDQNQLKRWRLILGEEAEKAVSSLYEDGQGIQLTEEEILMDNALAQIYGNRDDSFKNLPGSRYGYKRNIKLTKWLGDLRSLFDSAEIQIIQNDAVERYGLKELLFEPEMLDTLTPDIQTAALLLLLKDQIPENAKQNAREYIKKIVKELNSMLEDEIKRSVTAAVNKKKHSLIPSSSALDYKMTIQRNLKNYNPEIKKIIPEKFYFYDRAVKSSARTVILDIDQSGSMGESAIYSSVVGSILAGMNSLKTHIIAFNHNVTDLTEKCSDPVDLLYGIQLGGGTDINKSVAYCQTLITEPSKTTMFIVTDLYEGGNVSELLKRLEDLKENKVNVIILLAISDKGKPWYNSRLAQKTANLGIPCFAAPPEKLPEILNCAIKRKDLSDFTAD